MKTQKLLSREELKDRAVRFYNRYGDELSQIANLLEIRLKQLSLAYTLQNSLPKEAIVVKTRIKSLESFLLKLANANWPQFYYPTEVVHDLIGARIVCWFIDDCYGILDYIKQSEHFNLDPKNIKDYIKNPQHQGYRGIHLPVNVSYDSAQRDSKGGIKLVKEEIVCEIQIRTKLQDSWGDVTHEFYYKNRAYGIENKQYEKLLSSMAERLHIEDKDFIKFRKIYQDLVAQSEKEKRREGLKDEK